MEVARNPAAFNCATCMARHCDEAKAATCDVWEIKGIMPMKFKVCPKGQSTPRAREMVRLYGHYRAGHFPLAGGLYDQSNYYLAAMGLIGAAMAEGG